MKAQAGQLHSWAQWIWHLPESTLHEDNHSAKKALIAAKSTAGPMTQMVSQFPVQVDSRQNPASIHNARWVLGTRANGSPVEMVWLQSNVVLAICIDTGTVGLPPANHTRSAVDHKSFQSQALPGCWIELPERRTCEATRCLSLCWTSVSATSASSLPLCLYALILAVYFSASGHDYAVLCSVMQCYTVL